MKSDIKLRYGYECVFGCMYGETTKLWLFSEARRPYHFLEMAQRESKNKTRELVRYG